MSGTLRTQARRDFGDPDREYAAFFDGAALVDRSSATRIEHAGADALDLLHRLTTNDLLDMTDGQARGTIVTNGDARIIDVITVVRRPSQPLLLLGSEGRAQAVLDWLDLYNFGEDSAPKDITAGTCQLTLVGPRAAKVLSQAIGAAGFDLHTWVSAAVGIAGQRVDVVRTASPVVDGYELIAAASSASAVSDAITAAGATAAGTLAYDAHRVAQGIPQYGAEVDEKINPHEANLLPFVSFTKGCYIGQEVVARLDTYDKVRQRLVRVVASDSATGLESGRALTDQGRRIGELRSVAGAGPLSRRAALAFARRGFWDPGTVLLEADGGEVQVEEWQSTT